MFPLSSFVTLTIGVVSSKNLFFLNAGDPETSSLLNAHN